MNSRRLVSREDAAKMLQVSVAEMARKQAMKQVRVFPQGPKKLVYYDFEEIRRMQQAKGVVHRPINGPMTVLASYSAEEATQVFAELEKGASPIECVQRLTIHPDKVEAILLAYERLAGVVVLDSETMKTINALPLDGTFPITKAHGILELLTQDPPLCDICTKKPRQMCKACAIPYVRRKLAKEEREARAATRASGPTHSEEDELETA